LIQASVFVAAYHGLERVLNGSVNRIVMNRLKNSLQDFDYQGADDAARAIRFRMDNQYSEEKDV